MQTNPILERIVRLSEQWETTLNDNKDLRMICWQGASMSEYKMIKGFVLFHMSDDSTLDNIFINSHQQFDQSSADYYGVSMCEMMGKYIESWNEDESLTSQTGIINWKPEIQAKLSDTVNLVNNLKALAKELECDEDNKLVISILPERLEEPQLFKEWIVELLNSNIDKSLCFMLYDSFDLRLFDSLDKKYANSFIYLQPDFDLYGAMNQVLEDAKKENKSKEEEDLITYQQLLIKLTTAIGEQNEKEALSISKKGIEITKMYDWFQLEALMYYFLHNLYTAMKSKDKAEESIDKAILYARKAMDKGIEGGGLACCQYLVVKANIYLMDKSYKKATPIYTEALKLAEENASQHFQVSMYQMLGLCKRKSGDKDEAWDDLVKGWGIIESFGTEEIRKQHTLPYYALEMCQISRGDEDIFYHRRFNEIWGDDWKDKITANEKKQKQQAKAFTAHTT